MMDADSPAIANGGGPWQGNNIERYANTVSGRVARVEVTPAQSRNFVWRATETRVSQLRITRIQSDAVEIVRSARCIEADKQTGYLVGFSLSGRVLVDHSHRGMASESEHMSLLDTAVPFRTTFPESAERLIVAIPRRLMESRLYEPARYLSVAAPSASGIGRLALDHVKFLAREGQLLSNANQTHAVEMCVDLIALALQSGDEEASDFTGSSSGSRLLLSRVKAYVQCTLDNPELSPTNAADALGLSKRYLHKLFSDSGTTFGSWVREERLLRARSLLIDPRFAHLSITEIAMRQGFNDIPHFSRQFRLRFGQAPSGTRSSTERS